MAKHIITLPDDQYPSASAKRGSRHWLKVLDSVDTGQANGWAFVGDFATFNSVVELEDGAWVMTYQEDTSGAGRLRGRTVRLYQLRSGELALVERWDIGRQPGWALVVRDAIAAHMSAGLPVDVDALLAEREQLLARLAAIDAQLPEPEGTEVTTRQAATALGVSVRTVQRWAANGKVTAAKDDTGRWVITITI